MTPREIFRVYFVEVFSENNKGRIARDNITLSSYHFHPGHMLLCI